MIGPFASLDIFECDVEEGGPLCVGVSDVSEHLHAAGFDVDLSGGSSDCFHQLAGYLEGFSAGGESGHSVGQDIGSGVSQEVEGFGGD